MEIKCIEVQNGKIEIMYHTSFQNIDNLSVLDHNSLVIRYSNNEDGELRTENEAMVLLENLESKLITEVKQIVTLYSEFYNHFDYDFGYNISRAIDNPMINGIPKKKLRNVEWKFNMKLKDRSFA